MVQLKWRDNRRILFRFYSEEEVKLLLTERLQRIAEGNAVTIQQEEVKNHIRDSRLIESTLLSK